jgi:hypothetical protein
VVAAGIRGIDTGVGAGVGAGVKSDGGSGSVKAWCLSSKIISDNTPNKLCSIKMRGGKEEEEENKQTNKQKRKQAVTNKEEVTILIQFHDNAGSQKEFAMKVFFRFASRTLN